MLELRVWYQKKNSDDREFRFYPVPSNWEEMSGKEQMHWADTKAEQECEADELIADWRFTTKRSTELPDYEKDAENLWDADKGYSVSDALRDLR